MMFVGRPGSWGRNCQRIPWAPVLGGDKQSVCVCKRERQIIYVTQHHLLGERPSCLLQ